MDNLSLIAHFYQCFNAKDFAGMQACYHADAQFHDPAFGDLNATEVKAMWEMLLSRAPDLAVSYCGATADGDNGTVHWRASYTFSSTGRNVINNVDAAFKFKDGLIIKHIDSFNFYAWAKQSLGIMGLLFGRTDFLKKKVRAKATNALHDYMQKSKI